MRSKLVLEDNGKFQIENIDDLSYTYFPMCNTKSMKSSITPTLGGDATVDQNSFLLVPNTIEDLPNSLMKRHVFFKVNEEFTWSITGQTPKQILSPDKVDLYAEVLIHKVIRSNPLFSCEIESFVPVNDSFQELHKLTIKNTTSKPLSLKSVIGIPIYGRSAENIRDHRHVTSLLNRINLVDNGVINHPTFSFDERGHVVNHRHYGVVANSSHHKHVKKFHPTMETFTGEGHSFLDPIVVKKDVPSSYQVGNTIEGYETVAGMEYEKVILEKNESLTFVIALIISDNEEDIVEQMVEINTETFNRLKKQTQSYWERHLSSLTFNFPNSALNGWLKWVTLQPTLRRIYGNSFMPHHDYGRGGKGWRDLWQDLLALIIMDPKSVRTQLINNFKGVRIDGSNATIIGDDPGQFLADRNNITRIWMDHGAWPLLTTKLYLDQCGDIDLLFEEISYFQDQFTHYTKQINKKLSMADTQLRTKDNKIYQGTILEHLIIQNLVPYYNVGDHNNIRLEDADWNDGLDMAKEKGESVAFTAFYGQNLISLSELLKKLVAKNITTISLCKEIAILLEDVDQDNIKAKTILLERYFTSVENGLSGKTIHINVLETAAALYKKGTALLAQVRHNEWLEDAEEGWFNGYYDNDSNQLANIEKKDMTLTGQVFAIMSGAATNDQVQTIIRSADKYLYKETLGGYCLNTNFKEVKTNMGRLFGFAYGHKENGAVFSHMALMYANALYTRGFVAAGYKVINTLYQHSMDLKHAKIYPGLPEYFNPTGRGMYSYLTGSASWMILTMVTEVFGVKSDLGMPVFEPKLLLEQFGDNNELSIYTILCDKKVEVVYRNPHQLTYGDYAITDVEADGKHLAFEKTTFGVKLKRKNPGTKVVITLRKK